MNKKLLLNEYECYELGYSYREHAIWRPIPEEEVAEAKRMGKIHRSPYGKEGEVINGYIKYYPGKEPLRIRLNHVAVLRRLALDCWAYRLTISLIKEEAK